MYLDCSLPTMEIECFCAVTIVLIIRNINDPNVRLDVALVECETVVSCTNTQVTVLSLLVRDGSKNTPRPPPQDHVDLRAWKLAPRPLQSERQEACSVDESRQFSVPSFAWPF